MIAKATARYLRVSPRKVRQVADLIRGKSVGEALSVLTNMNKNATVYLEELLRSAFSNAKNKQPELSLQGARIAKLTVDGGPTMKRFRAASMGRATTIRHRTSHVIMELYIEEVPDNNSKSKKKKRKA